MQQLRYAIIQDDLIAFSQFHADHSPTIRRSWYRDTWIYAALFAIAALLGFIVYGGRHVYTLTFVGLAIGWPLAIPRYLRWRYYRLARRLYAEGSNAAVLGDYEAVADEQGLIVTSPGGETRIKWQAVERVTLSSDHAFLYIAANQAVVLPRRSVQGGDFDNFIAFARNRIQGPAV
jgi:hypothetical protein